MEGRKIVWGLEYPFHIFPVGVVVFHVFARAAFGLFLFFAVSSIVESAGAGCCGAGWHNGCRGQGDDKEKNDFFHGI